MENNMNENINELIYSIAKEYANAETDKNALKELYEMYKVPFYFAAFGLLKNKEKAKKAAVEAFRRIQTSAYCFEDTLNAQYWFFDVLYTLCANGAENEAVQSANNEFDMPKELLLPAEVYIKIYSALTVGDIASLAMKKSSQVKKITKSADVCDNIKEKALENCPDYWEDIISDKCTGFEDFSEKERNKTEKEQKTQKRIFGLKKTVAIVLITAFICSAITVGIILITKKFGSDIDKNEVHEDIMVQFNNSIAVAELNGVIYYGGDGAINKYDPQTKKSIKISDDFPKEILSDGTYIYYRNSADGYMYRIDADGKNKTSLCDKPGVAMSIYKGEIYFSTGDATSKGIYKIPCGGADFSKAELLLDTSGDDNLFCVDMVVHNSDKVFFASGIGKGVHCITDFKGTPSLDGIPVDEVYTLKIDGNKLYFDCKEASGKILLYCFDIDKYINNENGQRVMPTVVADSSGKNIELVTGAFDVENGKIYFVGEENDISAIYMLDEHRNVSKVTEIPKSEANLRKKLDISDIHIFGESIYYFCSDGKNGGDRAFFEYKTNSNQINKIF